MLVSQMAFNGQESSASLLQINKVRHGHYEDQFTKFKAKTTKGEVFKLTKTTEPIVILNFWASWCGPCITEFKSLNKLVEKFGKNLRVVGINNDTEDALKAIKKVEAEYNLRFDSIMDIDGEFASKFNITKIPSSIVYYKGRVINFSNTEFDFMSDDFVELIQSKIE